MFDYYQELARSAFADMLHDTERNHKYALALKEAIDTMKKSGREAIVLDIGTGSGLLAMLAAKFGADSVVTIETYRPVAHIAREIIAKNGFANKIQMICKHSKDVRVGKGLDMDRKANILVAEVFDTELIGEGAISTYNEAHKNLMEKDCICVPHAAQVYVQIVESDLAASWYKFKDIQVDGRNIINGPREVYHCRGPNSIHDIQLTQFPINEFKQITSPFKVAHFDFSGIHPIKKTETFPIEFTASDDTKSTTIFFWWELDMNPSGSILLSCAPHWAHPDTNQLSNEIERRNSLPWRDHWMQGCFHIQDKQLKKNFKYFLRTQHDEYSWNFQVFHSIVGMKMDFESLNCTCLFHYNSRNAIMQINDEGRRNAFVNLLKTRKMKDVLFVGDHTLVPLMAASLGSAEKIFIFQNNDLLADSLKSFGIANRLADKIEIHTYLEDIPMPITDLICDPIFERAVDPIQNIAEFIKILQTIDVKKVNIHPRQVNVYAIPVHFLQLYKIRWPLQSSCEGFAHENFDSVLQSASKIADENVEPFSLWEYPCYPLAMPTSVFTYKTDGDIPPKTISKLSIDNFSKKCNGIAFWLEWKLEEGNDISSGPRTPVLPNELVNWKFDRQTVHLIPYKHVMAETDLKSIDVELSFKKDFEKILFNFAYHH